MKHPGWAVKIGSSSWLGFGHGWHVISDAIGAKIFKTQRDASQALDEAAAGIPPIRAEIVIAWEPMCGILQHKVDKLENAVNISVKDIDQVSEHLTDALLLLARKMK